MPIWEAPEKMRDRIFRPLVLFLIGDVIQLFYTICDGSKAVGNSLLNDFLTIKNACVKFGRNQETHIF